MQVITGHGYFGKLVLQIRRDETPGCCHCVDRLEDTVVHRWRCAPRGHITVTPSHRRILLEAIGNGCLSRPDLFEVMVRGSAEPRETVTSFCEAVMLAKKEVACESEIHQSTVSQPRCRPGPSGRPRGRPSGRPRGRPCGRPRGASALSR